MEVFALGEVELMFLDAYIELYIDHSSSATRCNRLMRLIRTGFIMEKMLLPLFCALSLIWFNLQMFDMIPYQRCLLHGDCDNFCIGFGYNRSECSTRLLRLARVCECFDCDFVLCATYCTKQNLKFVGCSCFALPSIIGQNNFGSSADGNQLLTNECYDSKFFCQCSK